MVRSRQPDVVTPVRSVVAIEEIDPSIGQLVQ